MLSLWYKMFLSIVALGLLVSCNPIDPNPELRDTIYGKIQEEIKAVDSLISTSSKKLEALEKDHGQTEVNTLERKLAISDIQKEKSLIRRLKQHRAYLEIREKRRAMDTRIAYRASRETGTPWPKQNEATHYMTNQRLRSVNPNWNASVPKLQDRIPSSSLTTQPAKSEKSEPVED